jgi:hypothetical protein
MVSPQRSPGVDARGRRRPRVGPFHPLSTLDGPPPCGRRTGDLTGPLMLTPERPDEVPPGRGIPTLLDDSHHVHWQLLQQRRGLADHPSPRSADLSGCGRVGAGRALMDRLQRIRWQTVADGLTAGGSPTECAAALGLPAPATLSHELRAWADRQREHRLISDNDHRRVVQLAADAGEPRTGAKTVTDSLPAVGVPGTPCGQGPSGVIAQAAPAR